jgi:hypothetical protein
VPSGLGAGDLPAAMLRVMWGCGGHTRSLRNNCCLDAGHLHASISSDSHIACVWFAEPVLQQLLTTHLLLLWYLTVVPSCISA